MSDLKISELPVASSLAGTEELAVVQGATTKKSTMAAIATFLGLNLKATKILTPTEDNILVQAADGDLKDSNATLVEQYVAGPVTFTSAGNLGEKWDDTANKRMWECTVAGNPTGKWVYSFYVDN